MSLFVNSHIPVFCSFHIGLLHGERNDSVSISSVKARKKESREREREREKHNDINVSALLLLHTYAQKKLLGIRFICGGKVVSYAWRP